MTARLLTAVEAVERFGLPCERTLRTMRNKGLHRLAPTYGIYRAGLASPSPARPNFMRITTLTSWIARKRMRIGANNALDLLYCPYILAGHRKGFEMNNVTRISAVFEKYETGFPPDKLLQFQSWLAERIAEIPEQYRANADFDIDVNFRYGDPYPTVEISYLRPMTAQEIEQETQRKKADTAAQIEAAERRLAQLKAAADA